MISQTAKALIITAVILVVLGISFVTLMSFFDAKDNNETITENVVRHINIVKGGDTEVDDDTPTTKYIPQTTVTDEDGDMATNATVIEKKKYLKHQITLTKLHK